MKKYFAREDGQALVEYGLIIALVSIVSISSLAIFSGGLMDKYDVFADSLSTEQLEDGSYQITTEDGVYVVTTGWFKGVMKGLYKDDSPKDIIIPNSMDGVSITGIYQEAFKSKGLTQVIFDAGSTLIQIHARAFQDNELSEVVLPDGLQRIDLRAFKDNNLTEITLPSSVKIIEQNAFDGNNIQRVTIGANVTSIGSSVFSNNNEGFKSAYAAGGAGTYVYVNGNWEKQ